MAFNIYASGTLEADGTEQEVMAIAVASKIAGHISLANMQAGDTVIIRQYLADELYASGTYSGVQTEPRVYLLPKESSSMKVTLEQTAGVNRDYDYEFIEEETASQTDLELIKKIEQGRWKIVDNQMIFYDSDGVTPILTFNLFRDGEPTEFNPDERVPV